MDSFPDLFSLFYYAIDKSIALAFSPFTFFGKEIFTPFFFMQSKHSCFCNITKQYIVLRRNLILGDGCVLMKSVI